ncbi:MAG: C25 family cysteine peptidase, partial [candidate division WOR-3 bacterium]
MRALLLFLIVANRCVARITVIESDLRGCMLRYEPGKARLERAAGGRSSVILEDEERNAQSGEWDLPVKVIRVGVPQRGGLKHTVTLGPLHETTGVSLAVVPCFSWENDSFWIVEPAGSCPTSPVDVGDFEYFRSVRFVTLNLRPVQYDPIEGRLRWFDWVEVKLLFDSMPRIVTSEDFSDHWAEQFLINGTVAKYWKTDVAVHTPRFFNESPNWVKMKVRNTGIHRITGSELLAAGVPLSGVDPRTVAVFTLGEHEPNVKYPETLSAVPVLVLGGQDGRFDINDTLLFYGLGAEHWLNRCSVYVQNYFTDDNVYWFTWGAVNGRRILRGLGPDTTGLPYVRTGRRVVRKELDVDCPARSGLLWIWARLIKPAAQSVVSWQVSLDVTRPVTLLRLAGRLYSESGNNLLALNLNGRPLAYFQFGQSPPSSPFDFAIDSALPLASHSNCLRLDVSGYGEKRVYLDYMELTYESWLSLDGGQLHFLSDDTGRCRFVIKDVRSEPFLLDVTDPYNPRLTELVLFQGDSAVFAVRRGYKAEYCVAGRQQLMRPEICGLRRPGRLRDPALQGEYWIVSPREFLPVAQELARYRTDNISGISHARARAVALDEVYDDYCCGLEEPWAIKAFFADKRPMYGLLAGDATYDYRGRLGVRQPPGIPAYETGFGLDPDGARDRSALAIDAWYADFEGSGGSPDMALGRVTVRSGEELRQFVNKVREYETGQLGYWARRYLLLADDEFLGNPYEPRYWDPLGFQHIDMCENMRAIAGDVLDPVQVYTTEYPYAQVKSKPLANVELLKQLNLGCVLWVFFGHGQANDLTHESVLNIGKVPDIRNGGRIPFCYFGSCSVGRFEDTRYECIAEELVRMRGGAIATVGATKSTAAGTNLVFARNLTAPIFAFPGKTIGYYFLQAWPTDRTYHLFGDP